VAALILTGGDSGSLRVAAIASPACSGDDPAPTNLWVELEGESLLGALGSVDESELPESARVELYVYAMTRDGEIAASLAEWVRIPLASLAETLPGGGAKLAARLALPPGEFQLRILLREPDSQQFALRVLGIEVPEPERSRPFLGTPRFDDAGDWLRVGPSGGGDGVTVGAPAALPVVAAGAQSSFSLPGCALEGARFDARLWDAGGKPARGVDVGFDAASGGGTVRGELRVRDLATGLYRIEMSAAGPAGESSVSHPLFVGPSGAGEGAIAWTALGSLTKEGESSDPELGALDDLRSGKRVEAIATAYRQVLEQFAAGRREEGVSRLLALETEVVDGAEKPQRGLRHLTEAQNRVTRDLLDRDPECLLPLLVLHLDLQDRYLARGGVSSYLLHAARARVRGLAATYAAKAETEMAPALAAMSLVELAETLERGQQRVSALIILREAITLDPTNPDVLLDLAYQYENHGFDSDARALLERLLEIEPRSDEGRLRLAMNLLRAGRHDAAAAILTRLVRDAGTEWVLAVAYEELGQSLLQARRTDEAVRLLREGVGRLPAVQRLYIQLAYALDRNGQRRSGREVVAAMPPDDGRASPRLLYRVAPEDGSQRSRDALVRHGTARLPLLTRALTSVGGAS
jgi:tetratricopeptide (TPR) repeat protein